ncbi:hypothetical protein RC62_2960 [Flavobacterium aquidurense]|uniref:Uncharacterized protein n=1 Tax=Flavobacterium aquidurense TaxID=362413 RepID=A0A0Q0S323_9FLAO|nr:hypothetical protein RC62_2960 [Flavobacterium aquidurense]
MHINVFIKIISSKSLRTIEGIFYYTLFHYRDAQQCILSIAKKISATDSYQDCG